MMMAAPAQVQRLGTSPNTRKPTPAAPTSWVWWKGGMRGGGEPVRRLPEERPRAGQRHRAHERAVGDARLRGVEAPDVTGQDLVAGVAAGASEDQQGVGGRALTPGA